MHLTLVPFIGASGEIKTKPTQHSRQGTARASASSPTCCCAAASDPLPDEQRRKIALFTNVEERAVISAVDVDDIYKIPLLLHEQGLDDIVVDKLRLDVPPADLSEWQPVVAAKSQPGRAGRHRDGRQVRADPDAYNSLNEALMHAGMKTRTRVQRRTTSSPTTSRSTARGCLAAWTRSSCRAASASAASRARSQAVRYARENRIPYLGICLGMQVAIIEFARHVLGLEGAHSTEFNRATPHPVIALITEWQDIAKGEQKRDDEHSAMAARCAWARRKFASRRTRWRVSIYGDEDPCSSGTVIATNSTTRTWTAMTAAGFRFPGLSKDGLVEIIELPGHPWFVATQFHPEFTSTPRDGHPLFTGFSVRGCAPAQCAQLPEAANA